MKLENLLVVFLGAIIMMDIQVQAEEMRFTYTLPAN